MALRLASISSDSKATRAIPSDIYNLKKNHLNNDMSSLPVCKTPCLSALKSKELLDVRTVFKISSVTVPIIKSYLIHEPRSIKSV